MQISEYDTMVGWIQYSIGQLVWIAPGPFIPDSESYDATDEPYVKVYNLATSDVGYVPWDDFAWFPNAEEFHRRPKRYLAPAPETNRIFYRFRGMLGYEAMVEGYPLTSLVVSGEPRLDKWYHGLRIQDGTVGWFQRVRVLPHATQKDMQPRIERRIERRFPELETLEPYDPKVVVSNRYGTHENPSELGVESIEMGQPIAAAASPLPDEGRSNRSTSSTPGDTSAPGFVLTEMGQPPNEAVNPSMANESSVGTFHSTDAADFSPVSNDPESTPPTSAASSPTLPQLALGERLHRIDASNTLEKLSESKSLPTQMLAPTDFGDFGGFGGILDFEFYRK